MEGFFVGLSMKLIYPKMKYVRPDRIQIRIVVRAITIPCIVFPVRRVPHIPEVSSQLFVRAVFLKDSWCLGHDEAFRKVPGHTKISPQTLVLPCPGPGRRPLRHGWPRRGEGSW